MNYSLGDMVSLFRPAVKELIQSGSTAHLKMDERLSFKDEKLLLDVWDNCVSVAGAKLDANFRFFMGFRDRSINERSVLKNKFGVQMSSTDFVVHYNAVDKKYISDRYPLSEEQHFQYSLIEDIPSYEDLQLFDEITRDMCSEYGESTTVIMRLHTYNVDDWNAVISSVQEIIIPKILEYSKVGV